MRPLVAICLVLLCGCVPSKSPFKATLQIQKTEGHVNYVDLSLSGSGRGSMSHRIETRVEATLVLAQLESLIVDLKLAQEQMPVDEKAPASGKETQR